MKIKLKHAFQQCKFPWFWFTALVTHSTPAWPLPRGGPSACGTPLILSANIDSHLWLSLAVETPVLYTGWPENRSLERCRKKEKKKKKHKVIKSKCLSSGTKKPWNNCYFHLGCYDSDSSFSFSWLYLMIGHYEELDH